MRPGPARRGAGSPPPRCRRCDLGQAVPAAARPGVRRERGRGEAAPVPGRGRRKMAGEQRFPGRAPQAGAGEAGSRGVMETPAAPAGPTAAGSRAYRGGVPGLRPHPAAPAFLSAPL